MTEFSHFIEELQIISSIAAPNIATSMLIKLKFADISRNSCNVKHILFFLLGNVATCYRGHILAAYSGTMPGVAHTGTRFRSVDSKEKRIETEVKEEYFISLRTHGHVFFVYVNIESYLLKHC